MQVIDKSQTLAKLEINKVIDLVRVKKWKVYTKRGKKGEREKE